VATGTPLERIAVGSRNVAEKSGTPQERLYHGKRRTVGEAGSWKEAVQEGMAVRKRHTAGDADS
jgi:hypothetical protein